MASNGRTAGQASVELVAAVPLILVLALGLAQLVLAGYALWSAGEAARAAARAAHVGTDPAAAARAALPGFLEPAAVDGSGPEVRVEVEAPALLPGLGALPLAASAALDPSGSRR